MANTRHPLYITFGDEALEEMRRRLANSKNGEIADSIKGHYYSHVQKDDPVVVTNAFRTRAEIRGLVTSVKKEEGGWSPSYTITYTLIQEKEEK